MSLATFLLATAAVFAMGNVASCGDHHYQRLGSEAGSVAIYRTETFLRCLNL